MFMRLTTHFHHQLLSHSLHEVITHLHFYCIAFMHRHSIAIIIIFWRIVKVSPTSAQVWDRTGAHWSEANALTTTL